MPVRPELRVSVTAFPLGERIWCGGVAHPIRPSAEYLVGELLRDSTFSDGEDIRDSSAGPMKVSLGDAGRSRSGIQLPAVTVSPITKPYRFRFRPKVENYEAGCLRRRRPISSVHGPAIGKVPIGQAGDSRRLIHGSPSPDDKKFTCESISAISHCREENRGCSRVERRIQLLRVIPDAR